MATTAIGAAPLGGQLRVLLIERGAGAEVLALATEQNAAGLRVGVDRLERIGKTAGVAQKRKREVVVFLKRLVVRRGVKRDADNDTTGIGELLSLITQALSLKRSTGGCSLRVPPHQHPLPAERGQCEVLALLVVDGEVRRFGSYIKHGVPW